MRDKPRFLQYALGAWEMLSDLRIPGTVPGVPCAKSLVFFPLWGVLCGALCALIGLLAALLTNRLAGAMLFAAAALMFMLTKDSGRGADSLGALAINRRNFGSFGAALEHTAGNRGGADDPARLIARVIFSVGEFALLLLLGMYRSRWFLMFVFAGGFTVQGALAVEFGIVKDPDRASLRTMWIAFSTFGILSFLFFPVATVIGAVAVYALAVGSLRFVFTHVKAPGADLATMGGALAELALLLAGFFWTIKLN